MSARKITLELNAGEAKELYLVAMNGYGDGDHYGLNHPARFRSPKWRSRSNAFLRAVEKLRIAVHTP